MKNRLEINIAVAGNQGVGKTAVINQFTSKKDLVPNELDYFHVNNIDNMKGKDVFIQIKEYSGLTNSAHGYVLVFNPSDLKSFQDLDKLAAEIRSKAPNSKIFLLANVRGKTEMTVDWHQHIRPFMNKFGISDAEYLQFDAAEQPQPSPQAQVALGKIIEAAQNVLTAQATPSKETPSSSHDSSSSASSGTNEQGSSWKPIEQGSSWKPMPEGGHSVAAAKPRPYKRPENSSFKLKALAAVSGVLLLASLVALTLGTCGVGTAAVALGLTIGGAIGTTLTLPPFAYSMYKLFKNHKRDKEEVVFNPEESARLV